jgi:hypothetical protein
MDWNENDYHCGQSGVRAQGPDTAVGPLSLTTGRSKSLNESLNENALLNESTVLRHRFLDALGESTNSPVATFAQRGDEQPVRRDWDERLWCLISSYPARGVTYRAEQRRATSAVHLPIAQRLLDVPVKSVQPDFSLAIHQDGDYPYSSSNASRLPFAGVTSANISTQD